MASPTPAPATETPLNAFKRLVGLGRGAFKVIPSETASEQEKKDWVKIASSIMVSVDVFALLTGPEHEMQERLQDMLPQFQGKPAYARAVAEVQNWRTTLSTFEASIDAHDDNVQDLFPNDEDDEDEEIPSIPAPSAPPPRVGELLPANPGPGFEASSNSGPSTHPQSTPLPGRDEANMQHSSRGVHEATGIVGNPRSTQVDGDTSDESSSDSESFLSTNLLRKLNLQ